MIARTEGSHPECKQYVQAMLNAMDNSTAWIGYTVWNFAGGYGGFDMDMLQNGSWIYPYEWYVQ